MPATIWNQDRVLPIKASLTSVPACSQLAHGQRPEQRPTTCFYPPSTGSWKRSCLFTSRRSGSSTPRSTPWPLTLSLSRTLITPSPLASPAQDLRPSTAAACARQGAGTTVGQADTRPWRVQEAGDMTKPSLSPTPVLSRLQKRSRGM